MKRANALPSRKFIGAVDQCAHLAGLARPGKSALTRDHASQLDCADSSRWSGSLDIDAALRLVGEHARANRWDYGVGYVDPAGIERAVWIEVHSAETSEVAVVIRKLRWLKDYLATHALTLRQLTLAGDDAQVARYVWIASGRYNIPPNSPQLRSLATAGLNRPRGRLVLP